MSAISAPIKNDIAMQKDLFRLAAAIYSESSDVVSDAEIQVQIIRCMFVVTENEYLTKSEIIANLLDIYKYHISEDVYYGKNVPLFRRNGYRKPGAMIP